MALPSLLRSACALPLLLAATAGQGFAAGDPPNVIVILADDLGYGDLGIYGAPLIETPRLDQMASEGLRSTAFYVTPVCTPTRAALMTGAYPARVGLSSLIGPSSAVGLAPSEVTVAELLLNAGYRTGLFGKWHLGDSPDQLPGAQGFDEWLASLYGVLPTPRTLLDSSGPDEITSDPADWTARFTARALSFVEESVAASEPFFLLLSHTSPHWPATPSPAFVGAGTDGREYGDAVAEIDAGVGALIDRVDALGVGGNTLILFFSDNGPVANVGAYQNGSSGPLRGAKGSTFEGGVRSPFIARWPGKIPAGALSGELMHAVDLFDTLMAITGAPAPQNAPERDGEDVSDILFGGAGDPLRTVHHFNGIRVEGVRQGPWKLRNGELFQLELDPGETANVAASQPFIVQYLEQLRAAKESEILAAARPAGESLRMLPHWVASSGWSGPPVNGATWSDLGETVSPWQVTGSGFVLESTPGGGLLPPRALRRGDPAAPATLERTGSELGISGPGQPFALAAWLQLPPSQSAVQEVILDAGNGFTGTSWTVGDAGQLGDDPGPGQRDDLTVRMGGLLSPHSALLSVDLPDIARSEFVHLALNVSQSGDFELWLNGKPITSGSAGGTIDPGLQRPWVLFGPSGTLGGDTAQLIQGTHFSGSVAGIQAHDRALARVEIERSVARFASYPFCAPVPDASGNRVSLDLAGDFRSSSLDLRLVIDGVSPGAWGQLIASRRQSRLPVMDGYLCVARRIARPASSVLVGTAPGTGPPSSGPLGAFNFQPQPGSTWNFQLWVRDQGVTRFSNALNVKFSQ